MKAIVFDRIGDPEEVLYLDEVPVPPVKDGEVLVRMLASSINPGDFLFITNQYPDPKKPVFPKQTGGNHGAGIIEKAGSGVTLKPGTLVAFSYYNTWAEYAVVPAEWLIELPADYPLNTASQLINVITAWDLVQQSRVQAGQWLALTAGNSAVSVMAACFARQKGINVLAVVRRQTDSVNLYNAGASAVLEFETLQEPIVQRVAAITGNSGLQGLIDNLGGPVAGELIRSMGFNGQVVINGGISPEQFSLHNFDILMKGITISSHIYRYFFTPPKPEDKALLQEMITLSNTPDFQARVHQAHTLADFKPAIEAMTRNPEKGKRIFIM